jgi:hypothetical protein
MKMIRFRRNIGVCGLSLLAFVFGFLCAWPYIVDLRSPEISGPKRALGALSRRLFGEHCWAPDKIGNRSAAVEYARRILMQERLKWLLVYSNAAVESVFNSVSYRTGGPSDQPVGTGWRVARQLQDGDGWEVTYVMNDDDASATALLVAKFSLCGQVTNIYSKIFAKN